MDDKHPITHLLFVIGAWFTTVTLAQINLIVSITTGILVGIYTVVKTVKLLKDKDGKA